VLPEVGSGGVRLALRTLLGGKSKPGRAAHEVEGVTRHPQKGAAEQLPVNGR